MFKSKNITRLGIIIFFATITVVSYIIFPDINPLELGLALVAGTMALMCLVYFVRILLVVIQSAYFWMTEDGKRFERIHLDFDTPIPEHMLTMAHEIEGLGFTKLGVKLAIQNEKKQTYFWLWLDDTQTVIAYLFENVSGKSLAAFETTFSDGFTVETGYNGQLNVNEKNVLINSFTSSISEAYAFHMHLYDENLSNHGQAKVLHTLADTDPDVEENKQLLKLVHASEIRKHTMVALFAGVFMVALVAAMILSFINFVLALLICAVTLVIMGLSLKFAAVGLRPVNERKPRKVVEQ